MFLAARHAPGSEDIEQRNFAPEIGAFKSEFAALHRRQSPNSGTGLSISGEGTFLGSMVNPTASKMVMAKKTDTGNITESPRRGFCANAVSVSCGIVSLVMDIGPFRI
jgi:hypothetical protein